MARNFHMCDLSHGLTSPNRQHAPRCREFCHLQHRFHLHPFLPLFNVTRAATHRRGFVCPVLLTEGVGRGLAHGVTSPLQIQCHVPRTSSPWVWRQVTQRRLLPGSRPASPLHGAGGAHTGGPGAGLPVTLSGGSVPVPLPPPRVCRGFAPVVNKAAAGWGACLGRASACTLSPAFWDQTPGFVLGEAGRKPRVNLRLTGRPTLQPSSHPGLLHLSWVYKLPGAC